MSLVDGGLTANVSSPIIVYGVMCSTHLGARSKNDPTITLPINKNLYSGLSAAFVICVLSSSFGFFGKLRKIRNVM